jgi:sulfate transport system substrate-binding protein
VHKPARLSHTVAMSASRWREAARPAASPSPLRRRLVLSGALAAMAATAARAPGAGAGAAPTLEVAVDDALQGWVEDAAAAIRARWKPAADAPQIRITAGASTRQARAVAEGSLAADVVLFSQPRDVASLAGARRVVAADWAKRLPDHASPVSTVVVFVVRKGNPKSVHDWADLVKPGVVVVAPNPKVTTDGRLVYYAAWGSALRAGGTVGQARAVVSRLFGHAPLIEGGTPAAAAAFGQRGLGDAVVILEQQFEALRPVLGADADMIRAPRTLAVEHPVAVVETVAGRHGVRAAAEAFVRALWSDEAQEAAARRGLRPRAAKILAAHRREFPPLETFTVEDFLGGWDEAQQAHFGDGGIYDQILLGVKHD